jgi:hypothetical protein
VSNPDRRILKQKISALRRFLAGASVAGTYKNIAAELNALAGKSWTWNYIHLVNSGTLKASPKLIRAIDRLYNKINTPTRIENFETVLVLAPKGLIPENTILAITPKKCGRKSCQKYFIPKIHNEKYCSPTCRELSL